MFYPRTLMKTAYDVTFDQGTAGYYGAGAFTGAALGGLGGIAAGTVLTAPQQLRIAFGKAPQSSLSGVGKINRRLGLLGAGLGAAYGMYRALSGDPINAVPKATEQNAAEHPSAGYQPQPVSNLTYQPPQFVQNGINSFNNYLNQHSFVNQHLCQMNPNNNPFRGNI